MKIPKSFVIRISVMALLGLLYPFLARLENVGGNYWLKALYSFLFAMAIYEGNFRIVKFFRGLYPDISQTKTRTITSIGTTALYTLGIVFLGFWLITLAHKASLSNYPLTEVMMISLFISMVIGAVYESSYFSGKWRQAVQETERLKGEKVSSEYEILKQQVNPDFLFNSLKVIEELIEKDEVQAMEYTEKLSHTYRYILQQRDEELIDLKTEIDYVQKYLSLLQKQFDQPLAVEWKIQPKVDHQRIIPFSLQYLLAPILTNPTLLPYHILISQQENDQLNILISGRGWLKIIEDILPPLQEKYAFLTNHQPSLHQIEEDKIEVLLPLIEAHSRV